MRNTQKSNRNFEWRVTDMYRCPECGSLCIVSLIPTWNGAMKSWVCPCCGRINLDVETKASTSTENIDLERVSTRTEVIHG